MYNRLHMIYKFSDSKAEINKPLSSPKMTDTEQLARLLFASYYGTIDEEFDCYSGALNEMNRVVRGEYGVYLPEFSKVIISDGKIVSAALVTLWKNRPLLAYVMTLPEFQKQKFAHLCIENVIEALHKSNYNCLTLVVTDANTPAMKLYKKIGFVVE